MEIEWVVCPVNQGSLTVMNPRPSSESSSL
jgi:hypothetical protein